MCCVAFAESWATWLRFTGVAAPCVVPCVRCLAPLGSCSPVCLLRVWCCVRGVLGHLTPVHRCARSLCCVACAVSWATWLLFTGVLFRCVVLHARCLWPLCSCKPVCALAVLCCVCRVLADLATVRRCVCCELFVACSVSWATWRLFTGVLARCVMLHVRCPAPRDSCSPVCLLCVWCCVRGVLGHLAPDQRCARSRRCVLCALSCATWLLFTGVLACCSVLRLRCPEPLCSGLPVCLLGVWCCVCSLLGHLAPVHRCARSLCCVACAVLWATSLLFTGVLARCIVLSVRCCGPLGSCSPLCALAGLCFLCSVVAHLPPVYQCARSLCGAVCAVSWASSPLSSLGALCGVCGVLNRLAPVHRCARSVRCVVCALSHATWLLLTGMSVWCVVLHVHVVLGHLASSQRCVRSVRCVVCGVS